MALASSSASASRGASQPARAREGAAREQMPFMTLASFNFGIDQGMLNGKRVAKHCQNFARLCVKIVDAVEADVLFGCEVGGFRGGFSKARPPIHLVDILNVPFGDTVHFSEVTNYVSVWNFCGDASQRAAMLLSFPVIGDASQLPVVTSYGPPRDF